KEGRIFSKKEVAYLGLLEALLSLDMDIKNYRHWHRKISLVGSPDVIQFSQAIIEFGQIFKQGPERQEQINQREQIIDDLTEAMRIDLNIDKRKL
ncbi:MAG: hypothetical protein KGJ21_08810, partial [Pseudomonadota bacterium]|nr:hypothetical protein [Pseudomonadota bacterium]